MLCKGSNECAWSSSFLSVVATLRWDGIKCFLGLRKVCSEDFVVWGGKRISPSEFLGYGRRLLRHVSKRSFKGHLEEGIWAYVKRYFFFLYL